MIAQRFSLRPKPPFRLDLTVWALRRRDNNGIDRWDGERYQRILMANGRPVAVSVTQPGSPDAPRLAVTVHAARSSPAVKKNVIPALEHLLGLRVDLGDFYDFATKDRRLAPLARRFRGFKPPRFPTLFEALVNAVACQQLSLTIGMMLLNRLAKVSGPGVDGAYGFPAPNRLRRCAPDELRALGFSRQKARALISLADAVANGDSAFKGLARKDDAAAASALCSLHGIGRWSAEYALLRGLGRTHIFPGDDVGARNNLARWLAYPDKLDYASVKRLVAPWQPYAGLLYMHLLLDSLAANGNVQ